MGILKDKRFTFASLLSVGALTLALASSSVQAQSEASLMLSALPVASVVGTASAAAGSMAVAGVAVPAALSVMGATLVVKAVEVTASGTLYLLERASDGAQASLLVSGQVASGVAMGLGTLVAVSAIGTGLLLSTAGEVLAFIPNELGRALMHNERITR